MAPPLTDVEFQIAPGARPFRAGPRGQFLPRAASYRRSDDALVESRIAPGIYRFYLRSSYWEPTPGGGSRSVTTDVMVSDWAKVRPGAHSVDLELEDPKELDGARWEGRIHPARPRTGPPLTSFQRLGVALFRSGGERVFVDTEGSSRALFAYSSWAGRIMAKGFPPGTYEVWIGTEAQIRAEEPVARHLVDFVAGVNEVSLTY